MLPIVRGEGLQGFLAQKEKENVQMKGYEIKNLDQAQGFISELLTALSVAGQTAAIAVKMIEKGNATNAKTGLELLIDGIPSMIVAATMKYGSEVTEERAAEMMKDAKDSGAQAVNGKVRTFSGPSKNTIH